MKIETVFASAFSFELLEESKPGIETYFYPGASKVGGQDGIMIRVKRPDGPEWVGIFAFGDISKNGFSGAFTMPDPTKFCVVSNGAGYIVSSEDPKNWQEVAAIPIVNAFSIPEHGIVVFADYTELVAYSESGIKWKTDRLSFDGFKILEVTASCIKGQYYDIRSEENSLFEVDPSTGKATGGAEL
jgi:hypothetical protein